MKSCDLPYWLIQTCYQSVSPCVTEIVSFTWPCAENFQKRFNAENITIQSLNTVIPIIKFVFVWLSKLSSQTVYLSIMAIYPLLFFNIYSVLSNANRVITQKSI